MNNPLFSILGDTWASVYSEVFIILVNLVLIPVLLLKTSQAHST